MCLAQDGRFKWMSRSKSSIIITTIHVPSTVLHASYTLSHLIDSSSLLREMAFILILQIRKPRLWGLNVKTCNNWASVWTQSQSLSESRACENLWPLLTGACHYCLPVTTGQPSNWTSSKINCWTEKEILFVSKKTSCCIISASKYGCQQ